MLLNHRPGRDRRPACVRPPPRRSPISVSRISPFRPALGALLLAFVSLGAGCAHYQLGTGSRLAFTTLYVAPVRNQALLPQADALVAAALREAFVRDGRVTLVASPEAADATLQVTLTGYRREMLAANPADTGLARKFALHLAASCSLTDNRTRRPLFAHRELTATRDAYTDSGQLQAEYQTLPLLAESLAGEVTHAVLDVW